MKPALESLKKNSLFITVFLLSIATVLAFLFSSIVKTNTSNIALFYIIAQILIARYTKGRIYGIAAAIICVVSINYFFTYPYFTLNFTLTGYPVTFLCMLIITLSASAMTSHLKKEQEQLAKKEQLLQEAEKERIRANLLRAVSHDLRTPLTGIITSSASLLSQSTEMERKERMEIVENIYDDANWLLRMVENLLTVTRIEAELSAIKKTSEAVEEVISEAVARLKKLLPDAKVIVTIPDELLFVPMDATLIEQVIINFIENAIFHAKSSLPVHISVTTTAEDVIFHVMDYGIGLRETVLPHLFDGMFKPDTVSSGYKGMGIGLSICKTIIEAHKGTIGAKNHEHGAEFYFTLPKDNSHSDIKGAAT